MSLLLTATNNSLPFATRDALQTWAKPLHKHILPPAGAWEKISLCVRFSFASFPPRTTRRQRACPGIIALALATYAALLALAVCLFMAAVVNGALLSVVVLVTYNPLHSPVLRLTTSLVYWCSIAPRLYWLGLLVHLLCVLPLCTPLLALVLSIVALLYVQLGIDLALHVLLSMLETTHMFLRRNFDGLWLYRTLFRLKGGAGAGRARRAERRRECRSGRTRPRTLAEIINDDDFTDLEAGMFVGPGFTRFGSRLHGESEDDEGEKPPLTVLPPDPCDTGVGLDV